MGKHKADLTSKSGDIIRELLPADYKWLDEARDMAALKNLDDETLHIVVTSLINERDTIKIEFEREKRRVLESLPEEYKARFGEIAYQRYRQEIFPVLILNPYDAHEVTRNILLEAMKAVRDVPRSQ